MTTDVDGSYSDGLSTLFAESEGTVVSAEAAAADWTSSPWTLAGLVAVGCLSVTALLVVVIPVVADLVFGWIPLVLF